MIRILTLAVLASACLTVLAGTAAEKPAHPTAQGAPKLQKPKVPVPSKSRPQAIDTAELTTEQMELASRVLVGHIDCAQGVQITLTPDVPVQGKFLLETAQSHFIMHPVATSTGAIRLESFWAGAVWIQVANKSMLVSDLDGSRLADDCLHPEQAVAAQAMASDSSLLH